MWCLLVSQILFPLLAMMLQTGLSGEGARKVWLPFLLPNLSIQHAPVVSEGQGLPMAGVLCEQLTSRTGLTSMVHRCHEMVFCLPLFLIRWWPLFPRHSTITSSLTSTLVRSAPSSCCPDTMSLYLDLTRKGANSHTGILLIVP